MDGRPGDVCRRSRIMRIRRTFSRHAPLQFLRTAYHTDDWIAVLLKPHGFGEAMQRVVSVESIAFVRSQFWLRAAYADKFSVCVSFNVVSPVQLSRRSV